MLTFAGAVRVIDNLLQPKLPHDTLDFHTPVQFDPALMPRLAAAHEALNARFATLLCQIDELASGTGEIARECLKQFQELRRAESIWLYPVIAHGIGDDDAARARLTELRLVTLALARRTVRCFDVLIKAIDTGAPAREAADELSRALAAYLRRGETEIYPLYGLMSLPAAGRNAYAA